MILGSFYCPFVGTCASREIQIIILKYLKPVDSSFFSFVAIKRLSQLVKIHIDFFL